jgi:hypothetical protein
MPLDVALSRIPQDPAGFQQWKQRAALGIDKYIERTTLTAEQQSMATDRAEQRGISRGQLSVAQRNAAVNEAAERRQASSGAALSPAEAARQRALGETQAKFETVMASKARLIPTQRKNRDADSGYDFGT